MCVCGVIERSVCTVYMYTIRTESGCSGVWSELGAGRPNELLQCQCVGDIFILQGKCFAPVALARQALSRSEALFID